jgi:hypothetical protein
MTKGRYQGKMRQQIEQKKGVSAYGAYVKNNLAAPLVSDIESELMKQINRRINLNILRAEGLVKT